MRVALPDDISVAAFGRRDADAPVERLRGETMGTTWSLQIVSPPLGLCAAIEVLLGELIAELSHWVPQSAISRFNRAPLGEWQGLPLRLRTVLDAGLVLGQRTGGAFDPAMGRCADLWGFGPARPRSAEPEIATVPLGATGIERDGDLTRRIADVSLDLSGIAKGYCVDALANRIEAAGGRDFLVEIGGEFVGRGIKPDGQPWWVDLEAPPDIAVSPLRVALHGHALATSGDYRRFVVRDGRRLGHTLDPRTGRPVENGIVSVSVVAATCMKADAWATALTVLGPERGLKIADEDGIAARFVLSDGREYLTQRLREMLA